MLKQNKMDAKYDMVNLMLDTCDYSHCFEKENQMIQETKVMQTN